MITSHENLQLPLLRACNPLAPDPVVRVHDLRAFFATRDSWLRLLYFCWVERHRSKQYPSYIFGRYN